jgi:nitrogen-specific signal transduction histidine kinase/CheY-like chemotaxis protein
VIQGILMLAADVTERRRLQEGLREAQQMEALGQVAGSVAHDLNNLLTVISGYADLLARRLTLDDSDLQLFDNIRGAAERASLLIGQLLTISRRQVAKPVVLAPDATLLGISDVLQRILGVDVALRWDLGADDGNVRIDPGHFEQLVLNLAINARDAMPDGGMLTISTASASLAQTEAAGFGLSPGRFVRMAVTDTGVGMDDETRRRCFEPFFTTKDRSKGTGLGLAAVQGVVQEAGGTIGVDSEPGRGTTFTVLLPVVVGERPAASPAPVQPETHQRGSETVLVVDDHPEVRQLVRKVLLRDGYLVLEAAGGAEAVRIAKSWEGPIELLVTDVMMPGMRGPEVAAAVQTLRPSIRVLLTSAYTHGTALPEEVGSDPLAFLAKPFKPSELLARVREILDHR